VTTGSRYVAASSVSTGATNTITATSYDQYGVGVGGNALTLSMTAETGLGIASNSTFSAARTADSGGAASWGVTRDAATDMKETFTVSDGTNTGSFAAYWVVSSSTTAFNSMSTAALVPDIAMSGIFTSNTIARLVVVDPANDKFVLEVEYGTAAVTNSLSCGDVGALHECTYVVYSYDSDDSFFDAGAAATYTAFDYALLVMAAGATNQQITAVDMFGAGTANGQFHQAIAGNASQWSMP
jgi:hypothetical protein